MNGLICVLVACFLTPKNPDSLSHRQRVVPAVLAKEEQQEHPLGPPPRLDELAQSPQPQRRQDAFGSEVLFDVERISNTPHMFLLRNFVSPAECYTLQWSSRNDPKEAYSYTGEQAANRQGSFVSWLQPNAAHGISKCLAKSAASILFSQAMKDGKDGAGLFEQLQLVRYETNGLFDLHHDSDKHGRVVTVLYYLNGVAGTWFPLASGTTTTCHTGDDGSGVPSSSSSSFADRRYHSQQQPLANSPKTEEITRGHIKDNDMAPGTDGVLVAGRHEYPESTNGHHVVRVTSGDALVFYNYDTSSSRLPQNDDDRFPPIDWRGIHTALPASAPKCIATHWFHGGETLTGISNL